MHQKSPLHLLLSPLITATAALLLNLPTTQAASSPQSIFNVRDYGAKGDGTTMETAALNSAITACAKTGGGTVYLPPGNYLTGTVQIKSHVTLDLDAGATILGSEQPEDYPAMENPWKMYTNGDPWICPLIYAVDAENITITGRGTIDGQGDIWWKRVRLNEPKKYKIAEPLSDTDRAEAAKIKNGRPNLIRFLRCNDVVIEKINIRNSPQWNIHPLLCDQVRIDGVTITNPATNAHNTDGIDPDGCRNVQILNCRIDTGDDGITLKSGIDAAGRAMGKPDEDITIANCVVYHAHGGVTIGSEMSGGVRNVTVTNCVFQGTDVGIRMKSQRGRGGVVEGINISNIVMQDVPTPISILSFYSGSDKAEDVHPVDEGTPTFRNIMFNNISARGARAAGVITGLREMPISDVTFSNVHLQAQKGFSITNASGVTFLDSIIDAATGPALNLNNATNIDATRLTTHNSQAQLIQQDPASTSKAPALH